MTAADILWLFTSKNKIENALPNNYNLTLMLDLPHVYILSTIQYQQDGVMNEHSLFFYVKLIYTYVYLIEIKGIVRYYITEPSHISKRIWDKK